jgi:ribonuclease J
MSVQLTVHRASREIGGNCVELRTAGGHRIILDVGRPLDAPADSADVLPPSLDTVSPVDGVLVSHPHQDHYGLLSEIPPSWPVYCGEATGRLIRLTSSILGKSSPPVFAPWKSGASFETGPFRVTPFLTDHSAFDAYMLLIEVHGRRIFYSGDFRIHGRKSRLVERLIKAPPANLDVLIMEGTNLGSNKPCISEARLESDFVRLFRSTPARVFVAWSAQNVDRTVTLYRACIKTGRTLVVDLYTAEVLEAVADFGRLPRPGLDNLKVVITGAFSRLYRRTGREEFIKRMVPCGISASRLAEELSRWVPMVRASLIDDYAEKGVVPNPDDAWCWSMWSGYLKNEDGARVQKWFGDGGAHAAHIHGSGHASPSDLRAFARAMNARHLVPIHGVAWDAESVGFPPIRRLADGETISL